jgi:dethiobiotin synthetase
MMSLTQLKPGFFVTGTDTEIGKTLIAGSLILKLQTQYDRVGGFKPVVAGTYVNPQGLVVNEDLETLLSASSVKLQATEICPYIFDQAAAPHLVGRQSNITLEIPTIIEAFEKHQAHLDAVVVEGVGGFLVPLNDHQNLGDLAKTLNLPVVLVVGMRLGCINHALLSVEAILSRGLKLAGWVANEMDPHMLLLEENFDTLKKLIPAPCFGFVKHLPENLKKKEQGAYSLEALKWAANSLDIET